MNINLSNVMDQAQQDPYIYIHCEGKKTEQVFSLYQEQACTSNLSYCMFLYSFCFFFFADILLSAFLTS